MAEKGRNISQEKRVGITRYARKISKRAASKASPCRQAILRDGQVVGWEPFQPTSPNAAKIRDWGTSPAGKAARSRYLESRLVPATSTQSTWEAEEVYGPYLYAAWSANQGYHWRLADIP